MKDHGYLPLGMQSHRGFPVYKEEDEEMYNHKKIASMDREMKQIIKSFAGWLHVVRNPTYYFGKKPRILLSGSDFQLNAAEKGFPPGY